MNDRPPYHELSDLHCYIVAISPKMLKETLSVVEHAMQKLARDRPGYNAGGDISTHLSRIGLLLDEYNKMRPTGRDGRHGDRHTSVCGCNR